MIDGHCLAEKCYRVTVSLMPSRSATRWITIWVLAAVLTTAFDVWIFRFMLGTTLIVTSVAWVKLGKVWNTGPRAVCALGFVLSFVTTLVPGLFSIPRQQRDSKAIKGVVAATRSFQQTEGRAPRTLEELVPRYLKVVPHMECRAYGRLRYHRKDDRHWSISWGAVPDFAGIALDDAREAEIQESIRMHPYKPSKRPVGL